MKTLTNTLQQCIIFAEPCRDALAGQHNMLSRKLKNGFTQRNACDVNQLLQQLQQFPHAIAIINNFLPGWDAPVTANHIKTTYPHARLILTSTLFSHYNVHLVNSGLAIAYILKTDAATHDYDQAIKSAISNTPYFSKTVNQKIASGHASSPSFDADERKIFYLIIQDFSAQHIADEMGKSDKTIYRITQNVYKKTNCQGNVSLLQYAIANHYVSYEEILIWFNRPQHNKRADKNNNSKTTH